ncbi:Histidine phosphatase superfamily (branch 1) [Paenibacillus sp. UNCCL117]|uniref:histidine phosphatase family protein n=1 Tax=unclassified Paenibacillus TaxID=185978 RepID=UPI00087E5140|nr:MULTISPECIES: histidine phosphatase family protein [unclassified Paenibacillus]SDD43606.1 Histidine phosphatase superfamily (branch 1) [Paenibacillus sp. cl123]SFW47330.1 Histidine phosphatase superfamily (branch 1) [Paenibacillus sp. UNCCL117]
MKIAIVICPEARHAQDPGRRSLQGPGLTPRGRKQAAELAERMPLEDSDAIVAGPFLRMLQASRLWAGNSGASRFVHPLAGTRQYPFRFDLAMQPHERPLELAEVVGQFGEWLPVPGLPEHLWFQGVHTMPPLLFAQQAARFVSWCRTLQKSRVVIVTDEGMRDTLADVLAHEQDFDNCLFL